MKLTKAQRAKLIRLARANVPWKCANCEQVVGKGHLLCAECAKQLRKIETVNTNA